MFLKYVKLCDNCFNKKLNRNRRIQPKQEPQFSTSYVVVFFLCSLTWGERSLHFVDIDWVVYHSFLNCSFIHVIISDFQISSCCCRLCKLARIYFAVQADKASKYIHYLQATLLCSLHKELCITNAYGNLHNAPTALSK